MQARVVFGRQFLACEHDDRKVAQMISSPLSFSKTSNPDMSGKRKSSTTQSNCSVAQPLEGFRAGSRRLDFNVVVFKQRP